MLRSLEKHKKPFTIGAVILLLIGCGALVWFSINSPEQGKNPVVASMEAESASYFLTERDISTLARDVRTGAATTIGLSPQYALASLHNGERYYVRTDNQRVLVGELLKGNLSESAPAVFSLTDIQPPGPPLRVLSRGMNAALLISLLGPLLIIYMLVRMSPANNSG